MVKNKELARMRRYILENRPEMDKYEYEEDYTPRLAEDYLWPYSYRFKYNKWSYLKRKWQWQQKEYSYSQSNAPK